MRGQPFILQTIDQGYSQAVHLVHCLVLASAGLVGPVEPGLPDAEPAWPVEPDTAAATLATAAAVPLCSADPAACPLRPGMAQWVVDG
jgi:hypothetical protein